MRIEYKISPLDIRNNYFKLFLRELRKRDLLLILIPFLLYLFIDLEKELFKYILCSVCAELLIILVVILPYIFAYKKALKIAFGIPYFFNEKTIELDESGINLISEKKKHLIIWGTIYSMEINEKYVSIILSDNSFVLIPTQAFESNIELNNFIEIIKTNVRNVRKSLNIIIPNERPPYLLGLLGIVPVIGAFVGLVIVLTGIFKYKNIWFTLIGGAGILCSILVFSGVLTPNKEKEDTTKMIPITKERLNTVIKDIEYYKMEYGIYPDSLAQLNSFQIYDPAQSFTEKIRTFIYRVDGEKYLLFSSGYDGIENTSDDIYPEISPTSKVGLKRYTIKK